MESQISSLLRQALVLDKVLLYLRQYCSLHRESNVSASLVALKIKTIPF